MFKRENPTVQVGDRFIKLGDSPGRTWVVVDVWTPPHGFPHARVRDEKQGSETRIISVSTLVDPHYSVPVRRSGEL